ncbi:hypothetical protein ACI6Q2_11730 [Chitinophagaceae bacterium LWZ2-11]
MDEEQYGDLLASHLASFSKEYFVNGEVLNRRGKTDILVSDTNGNNHFIAECKLWKGEKYLLNAIEQLLENYVNWRDTKAAILLFNREGKKNQTFLAPLKMRWLNTVFVSNNWKKEVRLSVPIFL